jgi:hypothetical protein
MATKPSDPLTTIPWATDTNLASGPQAGETTKFAPTLAYLQQGAVPGRSAPGRYLNYFFNQLYQWAKYLYDGDFQGPASFDDDVTVVGNLDAITFRYVNGAGSLDPRTETRSVSLTSGKRTGSAEWVASAAGGTYAVSLANPSSVQGLVWEAVLPPSTTVSRVVMGVGQDAAGSTSDMTMEVFIVSHDRTDPQSSRAVASVGTDVCDGTADDVLVVSFTPYTLGNNETVLIKLTASSGPGVLNSVFSLGVDISNPGPTAG